MARTHVARQKMSLKKKMAAVTSIMLSLSLMLGGAFAWKDFSQAATNRFHGASDNDVLLHDDFDPKTGDKDVYVENTGDNDLYVRVQFAEYFQIGNLPLVGGNSTDKDSWENHLFTTAPAADGKIVDCLDEDDNLKESHKYYTWYMTGEQKVYLKGVSEQGPHLDYEDSWTTIPNIGPNGQPYAKTAASAPIITMSDWIALGAAGQASLPACWILDDSTDTSGKDTGNGWAYWSQPLAKGQATNKLLDKVVIEGSTPDDNYAYFIDVRLQATNKTELKEFLKTEDISDEAKDLLAIPELTGLSILNATPATIKLGGKLALDLDFEGDRLDSSAKGVIYEMVKESGNSLIMFFAAIVGQNDYAGGKIDNKGVITLNSKAKVGDKFKVIVTSTYNPKLTDTITVTVVAADDSDSAIVKDSDGKDVLIYKDPDTGKWVDGDGNEVIPVTPLGTGGIYVNTGELDGDGNEIWLDPNGDEVAMITGQDDKKYIVNKDEDGDPDGTYTTPGNGLILKPPVDELPGGDDDEFVPPAVSGKLIVSGETKFSISAPSGMLQLAGTNAQIKLAFADTSKAGMAASAKYYSSDLSVLTIDDTGLLKIASTAPAGTNIVCVVVLEDGSTATTNVRIASQTMLDDPINKPASTLPASYDIYTDSIMRVSTTIYGEDGISVVLGSISSIVYTMTNDGGTGTTVTPEGWVKSGSNAGTAMILMTVNGTITANITVNVKAVPTEEAKPYVTTTTNWAALSPAPEYAGGNGSSVTPYLISSVRQLKKLSVDLGSSANSSDGIYFTLTTDLDFTGDASVINYLIPNFSGTFDGGNHSIIGLDIDAGSTRVAGLFQRILYGEVKNLKRVGGSISGTGSVFGGIAGSGSHGIVRNCYNSSTVTSGGSSGGMIADAGSSGNFKFINCVNEGNISGTSLVGGIVGILTMSDIVVENCYNTGNITGTGASVGGILGDISSTVRSLIFTNSANYGKVFGGATNDTVGSITGTLLIPPTSFTFSNIRALQGTVSKDNGSTFITNQPFGWGSYKSLMLTAIGDSGDLTVYNTFEQPGISYNP